MRLPIFTFALPVIAGVLSVSLALTQTTCVAEGQAGSKAPTAAVEVISPLTPWRAVLLYGPAVRRAENGELVWMPRNRRPSPYDPAAPWSAYAELPGISDLPEDWAQPDFDDSNWRRWQDDLFEHYGGYGATACAPRQPVTPAIIRVRAEFVVVDPTQATDLKASVTFVGGVAVYVNGKEVGRGHLPPGPLMPGMLAREYPIEAYTTEDGQTPLPLLVNPSQPDAQWLSRYQARLRRFSVSIPSAVLVKGRNILAIEARHAPPAGPFHSRGPWAHVGIWDVRLESASGASVKTYEEMIQGTRVWNADPYEQISAELPRETVLPRSRFWNIYNDAGLPVKGIVFGPAHDTLRPIRMAVPRNGVCSGQVVVSDPEGVRRLSATIEEFRGTDGAVIPAALVEIRYAAMNNLVHYCDTLLPTPPDGARTVPVWLIVQAPRQQKPGWYTSTLRLEANGKSFAVPVQVLVGVLQVPDPKDRGAMVSILQSPDSLALQYKVEMWSEEHFRLLDRSFELLGQLGNSAFYVPVLLGANRGELEGAIRWLKTPTGLKPDFSVLERMLDLYAKHCGPPKALVLCVWTVETSKRWATAYEGGQQDSVPARAWKMMEVTLLDPTTGEKTRMQAPYYEDEGAGDFWKPMLDGVLAVVKKRGWSERIIMLGEGGDHRPSKETGAMFRQWAPYARWNLLSHFSGDPVSGFYKGRHKDALKEGKLIAIGDLEVGLADYPGGGQTPAQVEQSLKQPRDYFWLPNYRWGIVYNSPPLHYRMLLQNDIGLSRFGLDFWPLKGGRSLLAGITAGTRFRSGIDAVTAPGAEGAEPTVRFQMMREALQDMEIRLNIIRALSSLPTERQAEVRKLLATVNGHPVIPPARLYELAAELAGEKTTATWDAPPAGSR